MVAPGRRKAKGSTFERELVHRFWAAGWGAIRIAGSGSIGELAPDVLAGRPGRWLALEAKATLDARKYFTKAEVDGLIAFATAFGAEPWLAVKFSRKGTFFMSANHADRTEKSVVVSLGDPRLFTFEELIG
jgi:holliday junction resolvase Hjr